jgi:hypothetical protein
MDKAFDPSPFDERVRAQRAALERAKEEMEEVRKKFVAAVARVLREWYPAQTEKVVAREPSVTVAAQSQLKEMKAELQRLIERTETIAEQNLKDKSMWWHMAEGGGMESKHSSSTLSPYRSYSGDPIPEILEEPVRRAFGALAAVLEKYGYLRSQGNPSSYQWRRSSGSSYGPSSTNVGAPQSYRGSFPKWPEEIPRLIVQYEGLHKQALIAQRGIDEAETDKKSAEAAHLWKST